MKENMKKSYGAPKILTKLSAQANGIERLSAKSIFLEDVCFFCRSSTLPECLAGASLQSRSGYHDRMNNPSRCGEILQTKVVFLQTKAWFGQTEAASGESEAVSGKVVR